VLVETNGKLKLKIIELIQALDAVQKDNKAMIAR
jgi:hypothetical protein